MANCKTCGAELKDGDKFCMNCGTNVEPAAPVEEKTGFAAFVEKAEDKAEELGNKTVETFNKVEDKVDDIVDKAEEKVTATVNAAPVNTAPVNGQVPGKGKAIASLVLGLVAIVCWFFGFSAIASLVCGIIGVALAGKAKKEGYVGGIRTAGFVLSLIGLIGGAVFFILAISCASAIGCAACAAAGALY